MRFPRLLVFAFGLTALNLAAGPTHRIRVPANPVDRAGLVVTVTLPAEFGSGAELRDATGRLVPLQSTGANQATFIVAHAAADAELIYSLSPAASASTAAGVTAQRSEQTLALAVGGRPLLNYWLKPEPFPREGLDPKFARAGFVNQLRTPAGVQITDSYPPDHAHHYGIWSPWTKTEFRGRAPDFWNVGRGSARVDFLGLDRVWEGPVQGGIVTRQAMVDLTTGAPITVLNETWTLTAYAMGDAARPVHIFDLEIEQVCATEDPLILPEYHYGGLAFRGAASWQGAPNARILTSEGIDDRVKANATRAHWVHFWGQVDGRTAGATVLSHPANFRSPQPIRIHPNDAYFCFIPSQLGEWRIEPGQPYRGRYRFIAVDGEPDRRLIEAYWHGYAQPANAVVERL